MGVLMSFDENEWQRTVATWGFALDVTSKVSALAAGVSAGRLPLAEFDRPLDPDLYQDQDVSEWTIYLRRDSGSISVFGASVDITVEWGSGAKTVRRTVNLAPDGELVMHVVGSKVRVLADVTAGAVVLTDDIVTCNIAPGAPRESSWVSLVGDTAPTLTATTPRPMWATSFYVFATDSSTPAAATVPLVEFLNGATVVSAIANPTPFDRVPCGTVYDTLRVTVAGVAALANWNAVIRWMGDT
jgi:hypothetical protein